MSSNAIFPRLFVATNTNESAGRAPATALVEVNGKLHQPNVDVASICGMPYEECLSRFGPDVLGELIRSLEATDSGWFVRGTWAKPRESGDVSEALDRSIFSFNLSLRSVHCLSSAGFRTLRQVVTRTEYQLLQIKNLGRRSLNEIRELLADLGLQLGQVVEPRVEERRPPWWDINLYYLLPVESLQLSGPLVRDLYKGGIRYVGELASQTHQSLIMRCKIKCDRTDEIDRALLEINMGAGEEIPEWQRERLPQLHEFFESELKARSTANGAKTPEESLKTALDASNSLEEELLTLACWAHSEQSARIGMRYLGWDGRGRVTLEQAASEVGLTRERVRQIQSRIVNKIEPLGLKPRLLTEAIRVLGERLPCLAATAEGELRERRISICPFRAEGVLSAASALGMETGLTVRPFGGARVLLLDEHADSLERLGQSAIELCLSQGVVRLSDLSCEGDPELKRTLLEQTGQVAWLDEAREWLWAPKTRTNRILSRLRQILSAVPELPIDTVRAALLWKERIADSDLPPSIFRNLLAQQPWCRFEPDYISLRDESGRKATPNSVENVMFQVLSENGGVLYFEDLVRRCSDRGVTPSAIRILRPTLALITFEGDICRIIGTNAEPHARGELSVPSEPPRAQVATGVLSNLDPESPAFVMKAAEQLLARAAVVGLGQGRVWSLIELSLTEDDFARLRDWGRTGTENSQSLNGNSHTSLGLVMTAYCMEVARHEATEGEMWPQVYDSLGPRLRQIFFSAPGQPRQRIRNAMEYACRRLHLRHVFGSEGAQAWLRTVYLQFGVSAAGWKRLPWWLSGQNSPIAVSDLLRSESSVHSKSFAELWHVLQEYRWRTVTRGDARSMIAVNPWVSGIGVDVILDLAESHREVEPTEKPFAQDNEAILAPPVLGLRGEVPCFEIELAHPAPEWMTEARYVLVVGDLARVQITRDGHGDYQIDGGSVALMPEQAGLKVDLLKDGVSALPEPVTLEFYGADEEIVAFDFRTGRKLDIWEPIPQGRPCALLSAPDICLNPPAADRKFMFAGQRTLSIYRAGIPPGMTASLDGEPLWSPIELLPQQQTSSSVELVARSGSGAWGESVPVEIRIEAGMQVRKLLIGSRALRVVAAETDSVRFESVMLTPELEAEKRAVLELLTNGRLRRIPVRFETTPCYGAALESAGKWQVLDPTSSLDRADLGKKRLLVRAPEFFNNQRTAQQDWALLEGTNFCGRPRMNREFHSFLHGFGQSLELGLGPYNRVGDHRITVAQTVTDFGWIKSVERAGDHWTIRFRHEVDPGNFQVVAWMGSGVLIVPPTAIEYNDNIGSVACTFFETAPVVFGASYEGVCVGTGIAERPPYSQLCSLIEKSDDWESTARCLRWFHVPLMESHVRNSVVNRIAGNECRTLRVWTESGSSPISDLRQEDSNRDRWHYALRGFFERWKPELADAGNLIQHFELLSGDPVRDLGTCWERHDELLNIHPALLAAVADLGVSVAYPEYPEARRIFLEMLQNMCLDLPRNSGGAERLRADQDYLDEAAQSMGVDPSFILRSLLADARRLWSREQVKTCNLGIALEVRPFRQWLAAKLISDYDARI